MALASSSFIFQPPERVLTGCASMFWVKLSPASIFWMSSSLMGSVLSSSVSGPSFATRNAKGGRSPSCTLPLACSTNTVRTTSGGGNPSTLPWEIARMRVDLPTPFLPHSP
eukprot:Lithocolla_globosa_v1_NODE_1698_length_2395_cov_2.355983.p4 type:complete len:111 gc:universal NODE_1698_length_2395_cov_2.355983:976-1308(+)